MVTFIASNVFNSTPDATNTIHILNVLPAVTALWFPGDYVLAGEVINAAGNVGLNIPAGERHQFYYGEFLVTPNLQTGANDANVKTFHEQMIELIECQLLQLAKNPIQNSDIQGVRIQREKRMDLERQLGYHKEMRNSEQAIQNVNNGKPSGNKIRPAMNLINPGPAIGAGPSWPFSPA